MKLQMAQTLLNILSCNIGEQSASGYVVEKLLIVPSHPDRQREYLQLYAMNKCNDHGMIGDCYGNDELTIIFIFQHQFPLTRYQNIRQFMLKKPDTSSFSLQHLPRPV